MNVSARDSISLEKKRMRIALVPTIVFLSILWLIFIIDISLDLPTYKLGIYPLKWKGLPGILCSPFIHSSIKHLFSNTLPLFVLMWCLYYFYSEIANRTFLFLWLLSGIFTWVIGREAWHIGASSIIYSLSFFLFFSGVIRKYVPLIAISMVVAFMYGSNVWNMLPWSMHLDANVSWEGHLSGGISGFIIAVMLRKYGPQKPMKVWIDEDTDFENLDHDHVDKENQF
ncbi:MAG: rhomboid family intramembrane serine protease [Candidatus Saccharimonadaceae bacterium]